eukprot:CAMPEP_0181327332 /NCGR_PEP_ID=MMETSP1101-20121128/22040_1 /TAXON_ID=46948 /ORGANISM="Rhodomonas abbreviata, Strain Caron Lab Isolate" /LENGTH=128 /DNA_ID=CAMNT_0023435975 /DNA_START=11 /DNA_END=397 /DNA_ORIENTATION=+
MALSTSRSHSTAMAEFLNRNQFFEGPKLPSRPDTTLETSGLTTMERLKEETPALFCPDMKFDVGFDEESLPFKRKTVNYEPMKKRKLQSSISVEGDFEFVTFVTSHNFCRNMGKRRAYNHMIGMSLNL